MYMHAVLVIFDEIYLCMLAFICYYMFNENNLFSSMEM